MGSRLLVHAGLLFALATTACSRPHATDDRGQCERARATARDAWNAILPSLQAAADDARKAASNCDGPTRDQPPCSGQMSERFVVQSVTAAKLLEVERARDATQDGGALEIRETARLVKDDPKVQSAKAAAEAAYTACATTAP
jgi:hypothetical protein